MKKKRIIPVLLLRDGAIVQSKGFRRYQNLGSPVSAMRRLSEWCSDEVVFLDISRPSEGGSGRSATLKLIADAARSTFMPMAVGGGIRCLADIDELLAVGADKVTTNTAAIDDPAFVESAAREFGSQCIVVSIDIKRDANGDFVVYADGGTRRTYWQALEWAKRMASAGAGELLINSIDRDGMKLGYEIDAIREIAANVAIPVIALGGYGELHHLAEVFRETGADAVALSNAIHFSDQSIYHAKKFLFESGFPVRKPELFSHLKTVRTSS